MNAYRVVVIHDEKSGWWSATVSDLPGAHTEAKTLEDLDRAVREVIALMLDLPEGREVWRTR